MKLRAAITSALLCALFVLVYGACNQLTALRGDIDVFYFQWERRIPFIAAFIIPYMSIDLFFIAAPFLCSSESELRTFTRRIIACILIGGLCFLLFPLKFTFERPHVEGILGMVFNNFRRLDLPYNEFPSLHIALRTILAGVYYRHWKGPLRLAAMAWFSLIGFSTLFTYQHHMIDILGGFVLGSCCLCLFQQDQPFTQNPQNRRIGTYYAAGTAALVMVAWLMRPIGILLLWPAASLGLAAAAYFGMGVTIYRKREGRVDPWAMVALWPLLLAQYLSLAYYATKSAPWNRLADRVWIGRRLTNAQAARAVCLGVSAVIDLTCEFTEAAPFRRLPCLWLPVLDLTAPTPDELRQAVEFIEHFRAEGIVYIHCKVGYSRTAAVAGAWLLHAGNARTAEEAIMVLREARPGMIIRPEIMHALEAFAAQQQKHLAALVQS